MKKENIRNIIILVIVIIALSIGFAITIEDDNKCMDAGYDGIVTLAGITTKTCYIDNRPDSRTNIDYYPMEIS